MSPPGPTLEEVPLTYGESVSVNGTTRDGERGVGLRLARFPRRGTGNLSGHVQLPDRRLAFTGEAGPLTGFLGVTDVKAERVAFELHAQGSARLERQALPDGRFRGIARASFLAHDTLEPPPGPGDVPVEVEIIFVARHPGQMVRPGRMEANGAIEATVRLTGESFRLETRGKWHEQVGDRPRFGPAFTYMSVEGSGYYLLAQRNTGGVYGYCEHAGHAVPVREFAIDPPAGERSFRVVLEGGRVIEGRASVLRAFSVPIEGKRRPGTFVKVDCSIGEMSGQVNDWQPDP